MEKIDTLIHARWILPIAPQNIVLENHSLAIHEHKIIGICPQAETKKRWQAKKELHLQDHALLPGFINAHTHAPMNLFRGLADDLPLMDWLKNHIWPAEADLLNEESVADGTRLALLEMLRGGVTCFAEHYFFHETIAQVTQEMKMRACVGLWLGNVPTVWGKDEADYFLKIEQTLKKPNPYSLIHWVLAPHSPYMVTEDGLKKTKQISDHYKIPIHIHLHETEAEINMSLERYGKRPIAHFEALNLLSSRLIGVHMVHLTPEEIALIKLKKVNVVHCPESNLKLASGIAPIGALLKAGVNVAIGTDGAASNNDLDMLSELRTSAFLAKGSNQDPTILPAAQALEMATLNGAKAYGIDHAVGSLEPGKQADVIAFDLNSYLTQPVYNPISTIVYAANRLQVSHVWINGECLLEKGEFTQAPAQTILEKANYWKEKAMRYRAK